MYENRPHILTPSSWKGRCFSTLRQTTRQIIVADHYTENPCVNGSIPFTVSDEALTGDALSEKPAKSRKIRGNWNVSEKANLL
jgi:hypothetical protein